MIVEKELEALGLTPGEAKVYTALLELGSTTVGPLVKRSGIAYSNIYEVLQRLMEKGLASFIKKGKVRRYQAANPSEFQVYLEGKEEQVREQKQKLASLLPRMNAMQTSHPEQEAEIFIGYKGLEAAYERMLGQRLDEEYLFIYFHEGPWKEKADHFYTELWKKYADMETRGIGDPSFRESNFVKEFPKIKYRYTEDPIFGQVEVYGDMVLLVSWDEPITVTIVRAKNLAENYRAYFEAVWKQAQS